ncbi:hypothetical protein H6F90_19205 [Trichocoleus sp. FACHB-591]|uniref:hypothetical protein n=1 Tax=Trichocoleus sp. FACHB-591 TaxID=2692872 RepID=UPI0016893854|nr:hypothetical protein [Trichocoleus sp. FACHB-591]MBD2097232.1 hypothetical protein [Trichocoleus sp. FACHB-591]
MPLSPFRPVPLALVLGAIVVGCAKIDYDTTQPREWVGVEVSTRGGDSLFATSIDKASIKPSEEGVQFDEMSESPDESSSVATYALSCDNGTYTELQRTFLNAKGKPTRQEKKLWRYHSNGNEKQAAVHRSLCQEIGVKPGF